MDWRLGQAFEYYGGVWPIELFSGVMFWFGLRITVHDFSNYRKLIGDEF